jgi:hypothetical protein
MDLSIPNKKPTFTRKYVSKNRFMTVSANLQTTPSPIGM